MAPNTKPPKNPFELLFYPALVLIFGTNSFLSIRGLMTFFPHSVYESMLLGLGFELGKLYLLSIFHQTWKRLKIISKGFLCFVISALVFATLLKLFCFWNVYYDKSNVEFLTIEAELNSLENRETRIKDRLKMIEEEVEKFPHSYHTRKAQFLSDHDYWGLLEEQKQIEGEKNPIQASLIKAKSNAGILITQARRYDLNENTIAVAYIIFISLLSETVAFALVFFHIIQKFHTESCPKNYATTITDCERGNGNLNDGPIRFHSANDAERIFESGIVNQDAEKLSAEALHDQNQIALEPIQQSDDKNQNAKLKIVRENAADFSISFENQAYLLVNDLSDEITPMCKPITGVTAMGANNSSKMKNEICDARYGNHQSGNSHVAASSAGSRPECGRFLNKAQQKSDKFDKKLPSGLELKTHTQAKQGISYTMMPIGKVQSRNGEKKLPDEWKKALLHDAIRTEVLREISRKYNLTENDIALITNSKKQKTVQIWLSGKKSIPEKAFRKLLDWVKYES
jgi:hypothetical protein